MDAQGHRWRGLIKKNLFWETMKNPWKNKIVN